jgi:S1-C subfamily serine protease
VRVGDLDNISLGKYRHEKLTFDESNRNILGLNYWSRYVVTFDFPNSVIYLKKGRRFNEPEMDNRTGLSLIRKQGQTLVTSVKKGSVAAQGGVTPKDVVLKIDGKIVSDMSLFGVIRYLSMEGKKSRLLVRRAEEELELTIALQDRQAERKASRKK